MKKKEIITFIESQQLFTSFQGKKLVFPIRRNISKLKPLYDDIKKMGEPLEEFKPYLKSQWDLFEKYGEKLPSGELKVKQVNGKFDLIIPDEHIDVFQKELKALEKKYADVITRYNAFTKEYELFLEEDVDPEDLSIYKISYEDLPENLSYKLNEVLDFMITD